MLKKTLILLLALTFTGLLRADEGMWLPFLVKKLNMEEMQALGCKLTPEQIYSINQASIKDAIVRLDGGSCTGEMISAQGLLLTNHHCGYNDIREHSTVENDYLTDGFWAMNRNEELPNPGKTASFLVRMEEVTDQVLDSVSNDMTEDERNEIIASRIKAIEEEAIADTHLEAEVESMFEGNAFYLFIYETFSDVRLVGAPPNSIGAFGGDTDNWMWPRHTGDFTLFRVYTGPDGKPAEYSEDNIPMKPKHHLPVSLKGVEEGDFAMIMGYPGRTNRNLPSWGIELRIEELNPASVALKAKKMAIIKEYMDADDALRIKYTGKYEYLGNFWKKDAEEAKALKNLKVAEQKRKVEQAFDHWANADEKRKAIYGSVITDIEEVYKARKESKYLLLYNYFVETIGDANILMMAYRSTPLKRTLESGQDATALIEDMKGRLPGAFKDYDKEVDRRILAAMLKAWSEDMPAEYQPDIIKKINGKYKGDFLKFTEKVYKKSLFASEESAREFLENPSVKAIEKDPAYEVLQSILGVWGKYSGMQRANNAKYNKAKRLFLAGLQEMNPGKSYYPDANSTMRLTYGTVKPYDPRDAVSYDHITWLKGVMEKEDPDNEEFIVPAKLKELYKSKDFGPYGVDGRMPVCFLTTNDITGGNSGSPVINANGELIGTAFDGNSEAMSSDIQFDTVLQRTIVADIRYVLFVIDKYAGAKHLVDEMTIIR